MLKIISLEANLPNPLEENWLLASLLRGFRREVGSEDPVTPELLLRLRAHIRWDNSLDRAVWAACLLMFFCLLRKSNIFPPSLTTFVAGKHLARRDFAVAEPPHPPSILVTLRWSKTLQFRDRKVVCPIPWMAGHPLCPVRAVCGAFAADPVERRSGPALWHAIGATWRALLYGTFLERFKSLLGQAGFDPSTFAAHSFRRGGASWGFAQGLPGEMIKSLGDWKSPAYLGYIEIPLDYKYQAIHQFSSSLPTSY